MPGASSPSPALGLLLALAVGLAPPAARAHAPADPPPRPPPPDTGAAPPPAPISPEAAAAAHEAPAPETPTLGKPIKDPPKPSNGDQPSLVAPPNNVSPATAGMGGRLMSADDPEARRAEAELEGTSLAKDAAPEVPARLPPLQRGAWWCMFGAFALASAGGVFAGLAEVQEDKATRLAITLDTKTGSQLRYDEVQAEYEDILRVGRRDANLARGFLAVGAGFLVAGTVLFIVHGVRARKAGAKAQLRAAAGGLEVRF